MSAAWCWKMLALAVLALAAVAGARWWQSDAALRQTSLALQREQAVSAQLRASLAAQNAQVAQWLAASRAAQARGRAASRQAAALAQHYDSAVARLAHAHAGSCTEAMPFVDQLLRDLP